MSKISKEQLIAENARLEVSLEISEEKDKSIRKDISKFLDSYESISGFSNTRDIKILSWSEIYFELGKLKSGFDEMNNIFALRNEIKNAFKRIDGIEKTIYGKEVKNVNH